MILSVPLAEVVEMLIDNAEFVHGEGLRVILPSGDVVMSPYTEETESFRKRISDGISRHYEKMGGGL